MKSMRYPITGGQPTTEGAKIRLKVRPSQDGRVHFKSIAPTCCFGDRARSTIDPAWFPKTVSRNV